MSRDTLLRDAIRARRLRVTPGRLAVLRLLRTLDAPLSHSEVVQRLGDERNDRATTWRNLTELARAGLLRRVDLGDHVWRFHAPREADQQREVRAHFVCEACGLITRLTGVQVTVPRAKAPRSIARGEFEIRVQGRCDDCA